jgi:uncharacterized protein (TIGR00297 family)
VGPTVVLPIFLAALGVGVTVVLAAAATLTRALTPWAGAVAAAFGSIVVVVGGFPFLGLMVLFVIASVLATRYGFEEKRRAKVHEGIEGERGVSNVLAHVIIPTGLVVVAASAPAALPTATLALLYTAALAFGASDTFASEFGVLAGRARSILTLEPVPAGTNGGVSAIGEVWALVGALTTALLGLALFLGFSTRIPSAGVLLGVATMAGFLGCQIDSILGETLENRGWLTKGTTNLLGMGSSVAIAGAAFRLLGGSW